jgi:hypothetical protein
MILDWDIAQIEGALLETWLPSVFGTLEELARLCRARNGSLGAFIEDKNSGTILLQQARRGGLQAREIESRLTAMGKDERAISVSGYVHQGLIKYSDRAFNKTVVYKQRSRNHLLGRKFSCRLSTKRPRGRPSRHLLLRHRAGAREQRRFLSQAAVELTDGRWARF